MKKRWNALIITCLILFVLTLAATVIFFLPAYRVNRVYTMIDRGRYDVVEKEFPKLSNSGKDQVVKNLDAHAADLAEKYITGERDFLHTAASFDAIGVIDTTGTIQAKYMDKINRNEYKKAFYGLIDTNSFDTVQYAEAREAMETVQPRLDNNTRESIMVEILNDAYAKYLDGTVSEDYISNVASTVMGRAFYEAHDYALLVMNNVTAVKTYRALYEEADAAYASSNYFQTINICDTVQVDPLDTTYQEQFAALRARAYEEGKTYYGDLLKEYIRLDDKVNANRLLGEIERFYQGDFDVASAKADLASPWQKAYIKLAGETDKALKEALKDEDGNPTMEDSVYKKLAPDSFMLYDIDKDKTPEFIAFNSKQVSKDMTPCFIFRADKENYVYVGFVNIVNFCTDEYVISIPEDSDGSASEEASLVAYSKDGLSVEKTVVKTSDGYTVDGASTNDVDFLSAQKSITEHSTGKGVKQQKQALLTGAENFVLSYTEE